MQCSSKVKKYIYKYIYIYIFYLTSLSSHSNILSLFLSLPSLSLPSSFPLTQSLSPLSSSPLTSKCNEIGEHGEISVVGQWVKIDNGMVG